jgi:pSer/pThr/pTyr-binding forkhead associated (FHA) protein
MHAELVPLDGGKPIVLDRDVSVIGRKAGVCDVIVDRESVSKLHCIIVKTDGLLFIRDLGSTNGTKVNGQKVIRGALLPGDELSFAGVKHTVVLGPSKKADSGMSRKSSDRKPAFADVTSETKTPA